MAARFSWVNRGLVARMSPTVNSAVVSTVPVRKHLPSGLTGTRAMPSSSSGVIEELVPDGLWERVAALLPPSKPRRYRYPGRRPIDDQAAPAGIVFVLKTGIAWNQLPTSLVGCSGITCWRRLRNWTEAGVWPALHELLLAELRGAGKLDLDCCAVDGSHVRALKGGPTSGRSRSTAVALAPSTI